MKIQEINFPMISTNQHADDEKRVLEELQQHIGFLFVIKTPRVFTFYDASLVIRCKENEVS